MWLVERTKNVFRDSATAPRKESMPRMVSKKDEQHSLYCCSKHTKFVFRRYSPKVDTNITTLDKEDLNRAKTVVSSSSIRIVPQKRHLNKLDISAMSRAALTLLLSRTSIQQREASLSSTCCYATRNRCRNSSSPSLKPPKREESRSIL